MIVVKRPWGDFKRFVLNQECTVKIISVKPGEELSLQYHNNRKEMWYFITDGFVQIGNKKKKIGKGEIVNIPKKTAHRASAGNKEAVFLEISFGYFDEKDEVRIEDKYGRK